MSSDRSSETDSQGPEDEILSKPRVRRRRGRRNRKRRGSPSASAPAPTQDPAQAETNVAAVSDEAENDLEAEDRAYPRIEIPMLVQAQHPTFGERECLIENVSENGVFLRLKTTDLAAGAQLKLRLLNTSAVDQEATPTVAMKVARIAPEGLGLEFASASARHLWHSAERRRKALTVGQDYFQVQVNLVVMAEKRLLLLSRQGQWMLPNFFLTVGQDWRAEALSQLAALAVRNPTFGPLIDADSRSLEHVPETATLCIYQQIEVSDPEISLSQGSDYADHRWILKARKLKELTIASRATSNLIEMLLQDP